MNFFNFILINFLFFTNITTIFSFQYNNLFVKHKKTSNLILFSKKNQYNKITEFSKLSRTNNIIPTLFLSLSGGLIMEPSLKLFQSSQFISSNFIIIIIMTLSMVLNDIFDIKLDKINNPSRPLITGEITEKEAIGISILFVLIVNYLTRTYLSTNLKLITNLMLIGITIYTPFLKKITLIKNIYCALTISFCIFYTGLSSVVNINYDNINYKILMITIRYIFFGSLNNELLLDIIDIKGDRKNNIMTLPDLFGKEFTLIIVNLLLYYNIISNSISLFKIFNNEIIGLIPIFIFVPMIIKVNKIKAQNYSITSINSFLNYTTLSVLLIISYMCVLTYKITFL